MKLIMLQIANINEFLLPKLASTTIQKNLCGPAKNFANAYKP